MIFHSRSRTLCILLHFFRARCDKKKATPVRCALWPKSIPEPCVMCYNKTQHRTHRAARATIRTVADVVVPTAARTISIQISLSLRFPSLTLLPRASAFAALLSGVCFVWHFRVKSHFGRRHLVLTQQPPEETAINPFGLGAHRVHVHSCIHLYHIYYGCTFMCGMRRGKICACEIANYSP